MRAFAALFALASVFLLWAAAVFGPVIVVGLVAWHFIAKFW